MAAVDGSSASSESIMEMTGRLMMIDQVLLETTALRMQRCRSSRRAIEILASATPEIHEQLVQVRETPHVLSCWGNSHNFDENARRTIVHPRILRAIGEITKCDMNRSPCHAGLLHTYGYLFSVIDTPFGKKRDRWLKPRIARGFKLTRTLLSAQPASGTLLSNLTYFVGSIAHPTDAAMKNRLRRMRPHVAAEIVDYDYGNLASRRIIESVSLAGPRKRSVELISDLIPFASTRRNQTNVSQLLVYSSREGGGKLRLHTVFEMKSSAAEALFRPDGLASTDLIRPRYNSAIKGFNAPMRGRRRRIEHPRPRN